MTDPARQSTDADLFTPSATRLAALFFSSLAEIGRFEPVSVEQLPPAGRGLLAHQNHMTVALESHYGALVDVHPLHEWSDDASYARCSLLSRQTDGVVVQFGIMRVWLGDLPDSARDEIRGRHIPLGRVLIEHNLLREVEVITLWRIEPGPVLREHLPGAEDGPIYGRSAQILVEGRPTVQLLEIVSGSSH